MFTGLVEETGVIQSLTKRRGGMELEIRSKKTLKGLKIDDSISTQGVCLTVVRRTRTSFRVQVVEETLQKTTLGLLGKGDLVNLERSLLPTDRLGGHFVLGHVDSVGTVHKVEKLGSSHMIWIRVRKNYAKWLIPVGSIAVDGISLTVAEATPESVVIWIIPHTFEVTNLKNAKPGDRVNLEFDILAKYVDRQLSLREMH